MRLALLTSDLTYQHGWGTYSLNLIQALEAQGIQLKIIAARNSPAGIEQARLLPPVAPTARYFPLQLLASLPSVRSAIADCDLIHSTIEFYAPLAALIAQKRPVFITGHGSYVHLPEVRRFPIGAWYRWAFEQTTMLCVSHYTASIAQAITPKLKTVVIPNGVDFAKMQTLERQPAQQPMLLSAGGVKRRKGTLELIRAVAQVREVLPTVQCRIIGTVKAEPDYVEEVQAEIVRLNLQDHVQLLGFVDDATLLESYASAHVFVMPSMNDTWHFEGFGLVHLEASAAGLPVIGTDGSGAVDAIEHEKTGLIVSQERVEQELAPAILRLLQKPLEAEKMGQAGKAKAQAYTWANVAQQVIREYESALRQKKL